MSTKYSEETTLPEAPDIEEFHGINLTREGQKFKNVDVLVGKTDKEWIVFDKKDRVTIAP